MTQITFAIYWFKSGFFIPPANYSDPYVRLSVRQSVCLSVCKLFTFSSSSPETTGPISSKLDTKYPWVKGIQVCSNEGPHPSQRGDNRELIKIN